MLLSYADICAGRARAATELEMGDRSDALLSVRLLSAVLYVHRNDLCESVARPCPIDRCFSKK
jgi:hypothetical protein